jgi:monoamine oxidase
MQGEFDVVVVGAGAAGLGALARLARAPLASVALEARPRIGGRADTVHIRPDLPLDLGCGWLHSADRNPLVAIFEQAGVPLDRGRPHWRRQAAQQDFPAEAQRAFWAAYDAFEGRLDTAAHEGRDRPAAELLEPGERWNPLLDAVSTWYNGAELAEVSVLDYAAYQDSGVNWRAAEGYGAALARFADLSRIVTDCPVTRIRRDAPDLQLETARGTIRARAAILTAPTPALAAGRPVFSPALPEKQAAAAGLPLGLADKVFLAIADEGGLPADGHLFGRIDRTETGSYHTRPFGRPYIEGFFGGRLAKTLEGEGPAALAAFAIDELAGLLGSAWRARLTPLTQTAWRADPWSQGSYSHAAPGFAGARATLAAPVENRIFFAGEATSPDQFSTAHGAWETGVRAADEAIAALA